MGHILAPLPNAKLIDRLAASQTRFRVTLLHPEPSTLPMPLSTWGWSQFRLRQDCRDRLAASLEILRTVARQDEDHARHANGRGYSKADSPAGHRLSRLSTYEISRSGQTERDVVSLAQRYRRQAASIAKPMPK